MHVYHICEVLASNAPVLGFKVLQQSSFIGVDYMDKITL